MEQPPNFLVIVFDALRASDFPGGADGVAEMPFLRSLRRECWVFPNAVTPASWTVPSHASLLTGLYPWEHGAHGQGSLALRPDVPRIGQLLRRRGYRTALLASNSFLSPPYGLSEGFDLSAWGGWWEHYFRTPSVVPPFRREDGHDVVEGAFATRMGELREGGGQIFGRATHHLDRRPWVADLVGRAALKLFAPGTPRDVRVSTWIEPTLERWLERIGQTAPFLAVLNIQDTHEPFFPGPEEAKDFSSWWSRLRVRQDLLTALVGRSRSSPESLRILHEMYRWTVRRLDGRVRSLVEMLQRLGKWDHTWLVLTSDHGQCFGEEGCYFHFCGISEGLQRIPIWVRPDDGSGSGACARGLASLIDIVPTLLRANGAGAWEGPSAVDLRTLLDHDRGGPVLSLNDGLFWEHMVRWAEGTHRDRLVRPQVAAYQGPFRLTATASAPEPTFDLVELPSAGGPPIPAREELFSEVTTVKQVVAKALERTLSAPAERSSETDRKLRSWGYV